MSSKNVIAVPRNQECPEGYELHSVPTPKIKICVEKEGESKE